MENRSRAYVDEGADEYQKVGKVRSLQWSQSPVHLECLHRYISKNIKS
jgi:hypothetical protein